MMVEFRLPFLKWCLKHSKTYTYKESRHFDPLVIYRSNGESINFLSYLSCSYWITNLLDDVLLNGPYFENGFTMCKHIPGLESRPYCCKRKVKSITYQDKSNDQISIFFEDEIYDPHTIGLGSDVTNFYHNRIQFNLNEIPNSFSNEDSKVLLKKSSLLFIKRNTVKELSNKTANFYSKIRCIKDSVVISNQS